VVPLLAATFSLAPFSFAADIVDDFNDGNDTGWTHADLIGMAIGEFWASYSFPAGNSYRIEVPLNDRNPALGPARAGSYRADATYNGSFKIAVDIVNWSSTLAPEQDVGLLALAKDVGPGMLDCYACSYDTDSRKLFLVQLEDEAQVNGFASSPEYPLTTGGNYRFVFQGVFDGPFLSLRGEVWNADIPFDPDDPNSLLMDVAAIDLNTAALPGTQHTSGVGAVFCADAANSPERPADATFDNYCSTAKTDVDRDGIDDSFEFAIVNADAGDFVFTLFDVMGDRGSPATTDFDGDGDDDGFEYTTGSDATDPGDRWRISSVVNDGGTLKVSFPAAPGRTYKLACNTDLSSPFVVDAGAIYSEAGGVGTLAIPISPGNRFCRVVVEFPDSSPCVP
jgi:hypothetical protein